MPKTQAAINARIGALKAEVAALPDGSRERGLKQIEYGYALMAQGNDIDRRFDSEYRHRGHDDDDFGLGRVEVKPPGRGQAPKVRRKQGGAP